MTPNGAGWPAAAERAEGFEKTTLLIGLGAPHTGSRWLSNYFTQHGEILMSPIRVLHFFDQTDKYDRHFEDMLRRAEGRLAETAEPGAPTPPSIVQLRDRVRMSGDPKAYIDYFRTRWSGEKVLADITPSYYVAGRDVFSRMREVHPTVRFLFVMRNPIDRFWSEMRLARTQNAQYNP
ncbi:MAG: sulfotransferase, partial [Caulobacteraceae bacterium]